MIEIVFSDSAGGSLKMAQRYGEGEFEQGAIGVIANREDGEKLTEEELDLLWREIEDRQRLEWAMATPLGGSPADVYAFHMALSLGGLSDLWAMRERALQWLWSVYPEDMGSSAEQMIGRMRADLQAVLGRAAAGESLRIWYSRQPDELCGLYWFLSELQPIEEKLGEVYLVQIPEWELDESDDLKRIAGSGEVSAAGWHRHLALQRLMAPAFLRHCAECFFRLRAEDAPLRAVITDEVMSVSEDFYDAFIAREIAGEAEEFAEARLIGGMLGQYRLGIGDAFIAHRIDAMVSDGRLAVVKPAPEDAPRYHRTLRKCR